MGEQLPDRRRWLTPVETPRQLRENEIITAENELDLLRDRLSITLATAVEGLRTRDYAGVAEELEGTQFMANHLSSLDESLIEQRAAMQGDPNV